MAKQSIQSRFESKVTLVPFCECHLWTAATTDFGYGKLSDGKKSWLHAHRVSYQLYKGEVPDDKCVLHTCDNPACVNPEHLYLGSYKDNAADRENRKRGNHPKGTKHHKNVLLQSQVYEIRDAFDTGKYSFSELGRIYGIEGKSVADIVDRKNWKHLH